MMNHSSSTQNNIAIDLSLEREQFSLEVKLQLPGDGINILFGVSGSGKTTLLRSIAGLESKAVGHVSICNDLWQSTVESIFLPTHQRSLGYVFQEASLFEHLNVQKNINFGLNKINTTSSKRDVDAAIELLGIGHLLNRSVHQLSGGERQRVAIARALATNPRILLMDEPLAALDVAKKQEVIPWLERLRDELKIPMIYVTHSIDEAMRLGNYLVVLDQGRVKQSGELPKAFTALDQSMIGDQLSVIIEGRVVELDAQWHLAKIQFSGGFFWVADNSLTIGKVVRLRIMSQDVSISTQEPVQTSIQNCLSAQIEEFIEASHHSQILVRLRLGGEFVLAQITKRASYALNLKVGDLVWLQVKSVSLIK